MEINPINMGASTYAMKKAMEMPGSLLNLVQQTADSGKQPLGMKSTAVNQAQELATITGKGKIIDVIA